jgi:hypothetical protein
MDEDLSNDLMFGSGPIAKSVFGKDTKKNRRKVYHLHELGVLGTFKMGGRLAGRKSTIRQRIAERERGGADSDPSRAA